MSAYPTAFPVVELTSIINTVKSGSIKENIKPFAQDLWWVQGYVQSVLIGTPPLVLTQESRDLSTEQAVAILEQFVADQNGAEASAQALNPALYLLLKFALEQLMAILKDYLDA